MSAIGQRSLLRILGKRGLNKMPNQQQLDNLKAALESEGSLSKSQLGELLEIGSRNTIKDTLKACGLDTKQERYSDSQIWNNFIPAREMIEGGKKYKEVAAHFGVSEPENLEESEVESETTSKEFDSDGFVVASSDFAKDQIALGAAGATANLVQEGAAKGVKEVAKYIPNIVSQTILEEMQEGGSINQAFQEFNQQIADNGSNGGGAVGNYMEQVLGKKQKKLSEQLSPGHPSLLAQLRR